jgi:non-ribosomal peptide synthetase component F
VQTDLDVWLKRQVHGLEGGIEFPVELFDRATVQSFGQTLVSSALQLAANTDITLAELASASTEEQAQIEHWNSTASPFTYDKGVVGDFRKIVQQYSDKTAVVAANGSYNYAELGQRATQLAYYLQQKGLCSGQLVGVLLQRDHDLPALLLAIWTLGAAYVPLDPSYPIERVNTILGVADATMVVTDSFFASSAQDFNGVTILLDRDAELIQQAPVSALPQDLSPDLLAYVIFTSGSTGVPKGVEITQGALQNFLQAVKVEPGFTPEDRLLAITTIAFDISLLELPMVATTTLS